MWIDRVFAIGVSEFAPSLNVDLSVNPNANSPFAKWFASRYGQEIPANIYLQTLLAGVLADASTASVFRESFPASMQNAGNTTADMAHWHLNQLKDLEQTVSGGGHLSNPDQERAIRSLLYDSGATIAIIEAQYRDYLDGPGSANFDRELKDLALSYTQTYQSTPFLLYATAKLGLN